MIHAPPGRHPERLADLHHRIEQLVLDPRISLFAHQARKGRDDQDDEAKFGSKQ